MPAHSRCSINASWKIEGYNLLDNQRKQLVSFSLFTDKAQGSLVTHPNQCHMARIRWCLSGDVSLPAGPRGGQMGFCREELGPSGQGGCVRASPTHPCFLHTDGGLWLFSLRATQVTFRLGPAVVPGACWVEGPVWPGLLFSPLCLPAGFTHRLQLPLRRCLTQATSGWPLSHCLLREAPGGN